MAVGRKVRFYVGVGLALVALAGAMAGVFALSIRKARPRTIVFADGSRLTVLGASQYFQPFTTDKPWQATLRRVLPAGLRGLLPVPVTAPPLAVPPNAVVSPSVSNGVWVWFTYEDARGTNLANLMSIGSRPWTWNVAVSESGSRFGAIQASLSSVSAGGKRVYRMLVTSFPRRQPEFELQFLDKDMSLLGSVSVPNPIKGPLPEWEPQRLPITVTNGPVAVTLDGLEEGFPQSSPPYAVWITPSYRVASPDGDWRLLTAPSVARWSDATGNQGVLLDYHEKAWKLTLPFRRFDAAERPDAERFVVSGLQVPGPGTLQVLTNEFEREGLSFRLRCLAGAGRLAITNMGGLAMLDADSPLPGGSLGPGLRLTSSVASPRISSASSARGIVRIVTAGGPFFLLEASQPASLDEINFHVWGSDGQEFRATRGTTYAMTYAPAVTSNSVPRTVTRSYVVQFDGSDANGAISLEVTVNRARMFEFIVDPKEVKRGRE